MATAHLIHGFVGCGKTTFSKKLEIEKNAIRLTNDEWFLKLYGEVPERVLFDTYSARVNELILMHGLKILDKNIDVIFDSGFWSRISRDEMRKWVTENNHQFRFYSVICSIENIRKRVRNRTENRKEGDFFLNDEGIDFLLTRFEPMQDDEEFVVVNNNS